MSVQNKKKKKKVVEMANRKENKYEEETPTGIQKKKKHTHTTTRKKKQENNLKKKVKGHVRQSRTDKRALQNRHPCKDTKRVEIYRDKKIATICYCFFFFTAAKKNLEKFFIYIKKYIYI